MTKIEQESNSLSHTLKMCSLLKIEHNSSWVNFREKKQFSQTWVDFCQLKLESLLAWKIW